MCNRRGLVGRVYLERGVPVIVVCRWGPGGGPRNVKIRRADGTEVVRPFRGLRRPCVAVDPVWGRPCTKRPDHDGAHQDTSTPGDLLTWGTAEQVRAEVHDHDPIECGCELTWADAPPREQWTEAAIS